MADELQDKKIIKAKRSKNVTVGIAHIAASFNNTTVSITDMQGNVLSWSTGGKRGFRGSRKSTAFAAQQVAQDAARSAMSLYRAVFFFRNLSSANSPETSEKTSWTVATSLGPRIFGNRASGPWKTSNPRPVKKGS